MIRCTQMGAVAFLAAAVLVNKGKSNVICGHESYEQIIENVIISESLRRHYSVDLSSFSAAQGGKL